MTIENIHTHLARGTKLARAVREATSETSMPRFLAMLCILAVFIPTLFMNGAAHNLFVPLSLAVGFSMVAPVAGIIRAPYVMVVNPSFPAKTVPEFIAYAKANLDKVSMASGGVGSGDQLAGELFKMMAGVNMIHVPYRGEAPALADMLGGQVQVIFSTMPGTIE